MEVLMNKKILASLFAVGLAAGCVCSSVDAHGVFFANRLDEKALVLGEGLLMMRIAQNGKKHHWLR